MRPSRRTTQYLGMLAAAAAVTLMWPGPSAADTTLGGYSAQAQAMPVRIQIYEPTIPIPASPQIDAGIAFTRANTDTGPVSRALSSYLWPGDVIGDGFGQLAGGSSATYPVQVNSRYPATPTAPEHNTSQVTDGNGMTTSSDQTDTKATVTGFGIAGTNLLTNPLKGFPTPKPSGSSSSSATSKPPGLPVPVSSQLASLVTVGNVTSTSDVKLGNTSVTSTAHSAASDISVAGGLIKIGAISITSTSVSDGKKGTTDAKLTMAGLNIGGQPVELNDQGVDLAGAKVTAPKLPDVLSALGFSITYAPVQKKVDGANASFEGSGLVITIDTNPLKDALNVGALTGPVAKLLNTIPKIGSQLAGLANLGPKIVLFIGDATSTATASPGFDLGSGGGTTPPPSTGGAGGGGTGGGAVGTGGGNVSAGDVGGTGGGSVGTGSTGGGGGGAPSQPLGLQAAAQTLPGLGATPRMLLLGGILLAGLLGWALRAVALSIFGGAGSCRMGLATGVPDLRKG